MKVGSRRRLAVIGNDRAKESDIRRKWYVHAAQQEKGIEPILSENGRRRDECIGYGTDKTGSRNMVWYNLNEVHTSKKGRRGNKNIFTCVCNIH